MTKLHFNLDRINSVPFSSVADATGADLKRSGCRQVTKCPEHTDDNPSLVIYENGSENHAYCFVCQKSFSVIDYVMAQLGISFKDACQWVSQRFGIPTNDGQQVHYRPISFRKKEKPAPKPLTYIPEAYMLSTLSHENSFCKCMFHKFNPELVKHIAQEYFLGTIEDAYGNSDVIFWNIDRYGRVCNGKVQRYCSDPTSPDFFHCSRNVMYWLGSSLAKQGIVPADAEFQNQCLFGEHLLNVYPTADVMLVESPKNALIGAAFCPQHVWVATGSKSMLKRQTLEALRGRRVIVYPDRDAIGDWKQQIETMSDIANFTVSDICETLALVGEGKCDIADLLLSNIP